MSVVFSGTNQGTFVSTGAAQNISLRSDVDWMIVTNQTKLIANAVSTGLKFEWQRGYAAGTGIEWQNNGAGTATFMKWLTAGGFTLFNNTINTPGNSVVLTSITSATPPVVATGSTAGLSVGDIVRIFNTTGAQQLGGLDYTIGTIVANTSFTLAYLNSTNLAAATTGTYRRIPYNPYFYPPTRLIAAIDVATAAGAIAAAGSPALASNQAIVTLTVTHAFTVGQVIRFVVPTVTATAYGMPQLDGVQATIISVGDTSSTAAGATTNTIRVDVDVSSFGTFVWPLTTDPVHTPAQVVPVGENTAVAIAAGSNILGDSEVNLGAIGMTLAAGTNSPAGVVGDVIYWIAGKSFNV